ncbi:MAG TPA: MaoC family dehydratase N-terminal domain-containing protein [Actinomycetota bacterium]|nr:MaoC family dehydratase N-terminal domain-containing protein [Actinomycetota bacterium]
MALNADLVGKTYPLVRIEVESERVRAFAAAVGYPDDGVPPTFVTVPEIVAGLGNVVHDPDLGLDLARVLHGDQEYRWQRPIQVGETLVAHATIDSIRGKGDTEFLAIRTEISDAAGAVVVEARTTLIVRSVA